jgi:hypothetical protein
MKRQSLKVSVNELARITLPAEVCNMRCFEIFAAEVHMPICGRFYVSGEEAVDGVVNWEGICFEI